MTTHFQPPVVILANGSFPSHKVPLQILDDAGTVICTDGSADKLIACGRIPHIIIGDGDSTSMDKESFKGLWIEALDQNKTDLHKTLEWCMLNEINEVVILGATGSREDHTLGNLHLLADFSQKMSIYFVSDYAKIFSINGERKFQCEKGQQVSIVSIEHVESLTTNGLKFPLKNESLPPACNAISNETLGNEFSIMTSHPLWLFINHPI